jgi:hypothetical protein
MTTDRPDPFPDDVLDALPDHVRASLTPDQVIALREALGRTRAQDHTRHLLDLRGTLPLYWTRLYFVLLCGRDRRQQVRTVQAGRRAAAGQFLRALLVLIILGLLALGLTLLLLLGLYALKSAWGIDLFPDTHLRDLLGLEPS